MQLLGRRGFVVDTARTGEEALHCIASETYQAILLDMKLPNPDGFEIVERLRRERPDVLARTIIVTASPRAMKDANRRAICRRRIGDGRMGIAGRGPSYLTRRL